MNWRKLYPSVDKLCRLPGLLLICIVSASATIGMLYLQDPFEEFFQYLPAWAAVLYFFGRIFYCFYNKVIITTNELLAYSFIISTAISLTVQHMLALDVIDQLNQSSWEYTFAMWVFGVFYFFAGGSCAGANYPKSNILAIILCALVILPLLHALEGNFLLDYYRMKTSLGMMSFSHLSISEWVVFLFFAAYGFSSSKMRPLVIVLAIVCLFSLQGRASTIFTTLTFVIYGFLSVGRKFLLSLVAILVLVTAGYLTFPVEDILFAEDSSSLDRMLISSEDGSLEGRADIFSLSVGHLPESALYGDPVFIAEEGGHMGSYIHNLLSLWQFFGVLPFFLMCVMLIRAMFSMARLIRSGKYTVMQEIASMLLIYSVLSVMLAKSIVFYWIWFVAGYWMLHYKRTAPDFRMPKKRRRKRRSSRRYTPGLGQKLRF